jgi:hypothetical protein
VNPDTKVTVGLGGRTNPPSNVTEMVLGAARAPDAEGVKPTVQVEMAWAKREPGVKVTPVGVVAVMTTGAAGLAAESLVVATLKVAAGLLPAPGLVIPAMVTVAAVLLARTQEPVRVMVTTWPAFVPGAEAQVPVNPDPKVTAGVAGRTNPGANVTVTVLGAARAPAAELVKPTVQVEVAWAALEPGAKVTAVVGAADATS